MIESLIDGDIRIITDGFRNWIEISSTHGRILTGSEVLLIKQQIMSNQEKLVELEDIELKYEELRKVQSKANQVLEKQNKEMMNKK